MAVTTNTVTGTITSATSTLYTAPGSGVAKITNFTVTNASGNTATLNVNSADPSVDNFEIYTSLGASYSGDSYSVTSQESNPYGVTFNNDGTKMYVVGSNQRRVYEYPLSTAWDITSAGASSNTLIQNEVYYPADVSFGNGGLKMYVGTYQTLQDSAEYDLSVAYDVTTATANSTFNYTTFNNNSDFYIIGGITFNTDGTKMYVRTSYGANKLNQFNLSTAWDVSSLNFASRVTLTLTGTGNSKAVPSSDGKRFYYTEYTNDVVREIELSTAWDLSTATDSVRSFDVSTQDTFPYGIALGNSDSNIFVMGNSNDTVFKYNLSLFGDEYLTPWSLSGPTFAHKSPTFTSQESTPYGFDFKSDGTKLYVIGATQADIFQYSLSTPFDVSTATYDSVATTGLVAAGWDLVFKSDGSKVFVIDGARYIEEYTLGTAWDLSTISSMVNQLDTYADFGNTNYQYGFTVKPDGTRLYVVSAGSSPYIQQYNLSSAWDLSTASANVSIGSVAQRGIGFIEDGSVMFTGETGNILRKWNLSTPWEVDSAVSAQTYDLDNLDTPAGGVNNVLNFKLIQSQLQIACMDYSDDDILTFNIYQSAGVGNAPAGKLSLRKGSTVYDSRSDKINIGSLVMGANTIIQADSTEDLSYTITVQELSGDIASGFNVANKTLTSGTQKQTILEATTDTRIYGCQVTNYDGASSVTFTTYLNDVAIVTKTVPVGKSVLGITPGLSLSAGDVLEIQPGGVADIQVSLTYEEI